MKKIVEFFKKIKLGLKDPKTKSLTLLGIYALFFIFVFVVLNTAKTVSNDTVVDNKVKEEDKTVKSYEYSININNNGILTTITGTYSNNEEVFNLNNNKYYVKDDIVYIVENGIKKQIDFDNYIKNYRYNKIEELIKNGSFVEKTTYKDNTEKSTYNISIKKYNELLNKNIDCSKVNCIISIPFVVESRENINEVTLDLSSYFNYTYLVEVNYMNINNIKELKISTLSE